MASDDTSRVDALLREFRRPAAEPKTFGGAGRKLQDNGPRQIVGAAAADVDASMAWMEQRVKQLDMLAAEQQQERDALPSQRKPKAAPRTSAHTSVNDSTIAELASMERELRQATMRLQAESARAAALRAQLAAASVDASAVASAVAAAPAPATASTAARAAVQVRPAATSGSRSSSGSGSGEAGTAAAELREAAARRAAQVRKQLPGVRAQLEAAAHEATQLETLVRSSGLEVADAADGAPAGVGGGGDSGSPHPVALYAQLQRLDRAQRAALDADLSAVAGGARREASTARDGASTARDGASTARDGASTARDGAVHSLRNGHAPKVPLTVFADGFMLYRGPFRPFGAEEASGFAEQVMAGYLPHELQQRHPSGFELELHDCTSETHACALAAAHARAAAARGIAGLADLDAVYALLAPQSAEQLVRKLPESVVRDGTVVPVRSEVAALLGAAHLGAPAAKGKAVVLGRGGSQQGAAHDAQHDAEAVREARLRRFGGGAS
jgi:X-X-X-Leu-X-X-Gly heptad repeat protein